MTDIAIITAFFPIKSKQNPSFYLTYALPFLSNCKKHVVLFTNEEYSSIFREMRGTLPLTLIVDQIGEDSLPTDMPIKNVLSLEKWEELALIMTRRHDWVKKLESGCFSVPLIQLWLSKSWFVQRTLKMEEFQDFRVFIWSDIGSCRHDIDQKNVSRWPSLNKLKLRGYEDDKLIFYQKRSHNVHEDLKPELDKSPVVAGSFILGTRKAWEPACEDIAYFVKENAELFNDGINDQTIYYFLTQKLPNKYSLYDIGCCHNDGRYFIGWFESYAQDIDYVNPDFSFDTKGTIILVRDFLYDQTAKNIAKYLREINKAWWSVSIFPDFQNKIYSANFSDTLYEDSLYKNAREYSLSVFNHGLFSYSFKRSGKHYDACRCSMCFLRTLFDSTEVKYALSQIIGETVTQLNETFCSKYEHGDYLSIHHDKKKGDYAFVFQLTEDWNPAFGGLLHFYDKESKTVYETVNPIFNSLTIFKIKDVTCTDHFVSANVSLHTRYAFTGWFSVASNEADSIKGKKA